MARKLGRGLDSLIPTDEPTVSADREVPIGSVHANPSQPRRHFDEEALRDLASSIKEHGIIQPLVVTEKDGAYELIAGERRLQAASLAGLSEVPIVIRSATEQQKLEVSLIENVQRLNLSPVEEARAYHRLTAEFNLTHDEVADKMGKSRVAISNTIRLLQLPDQILKALDENKLSEGHARAILVAPEEERLALFERVLREELTVRDTEHAARVRNEEIIPAAKAKVERLSQVEGAIREKLGTKVRVTSRAGKGQIQISYNSREELERLLESLGIKLD
jgi:ParB family chromosome partitioning protein